jgi:hypothetical protein
MLFIALTLHLSCSNFPTQTAPTSRAFTENLLSESELAGLAKLGLAITSDFPAEKHAYVFIGRSPTALYALMQEHKYLFPRAQVLTLPLSEVGQIDNLIEIKYNKMADQSQPAIDYFQKISDHFDTYLIDSLTSLSTEKKLVLIDFAVGGDSLGQTKRTIDFYLRNKAMQDPHYKNLSTIQTEYVAITHKSDDLSSIRKTIDSYRKPFQPRLTGLQTMIRVDQLEKSTGTLVTVDMDKRIQNVNAVNDMWHWDGKIIAMDQLGIPSQLIDRFFKQEFDIMSPYGSWNLRYSVLLTQKPPIRDEFIKLKAMLSMCTL